MILELNPRQKYFLRTSDGRIIIISGSVRSGKTFVSLIRYIQALAEDARHLPKDAIDVMIGKSFGSLKRNVAIPLREMIGPDAQIVGNEFRVWGRTVYLIGANDERSEGQIRGSSIRKCLGDEVTLWPESFFRMLDSRLSFEESQFFGTTNPGPPKHYLKADYIDKADGKAIQVYHFNLEDNKKLSEKYIEAIKKNFTGLFYRRFILGQWVVAEGAIYDFWDEALHTISTTPEADEYYVGVDYGTGNPTVFLLFGYNPASSTKVWLEREYYYDGRKHNKQKTDAEYCDDLKAFLRGVSPSKIIIDPSAASFKEAVRREGLGPVADAENAVLDGIRTQASMLKSGEYKVHSRCKNTIEEYSAYVWDSRAQTLRGEDKPVKVDDHTKDAERYVLHTLFGGSRIDYTKLGALW